MTMNRRKLITLMGAAAAAPISSPWDARIHTVVHHAEKCAIITVADQTIPYMQVYAQFDVFRSHNKALGLPFDEHMCFGLSAGDGSKNYAKSCAKLCNGWIANMRRDGINKITVIAWSRRFGHALTVPMLINADVRLARTSGHPRKFVSAILRAANKKPSVRHPTWLECCDATGKYAYHFLIDHSFKPLFPDELPGLNE